MIHLQGVPSSNEFISTDLSHNFLLLWEISGRKSGNHFVAAENLLDNSFTIHFLLFSA